MLQPATRDEIRSLIVRGLLTRPVRLPPLSVHAQHLMFFLRKPRQFGMPTSLRGCIQTIV